MSLITAMLFCGCTPTTEYDDLVISKIETTCVEGMAPFPRKFVRTFDFETGTVTDTWVANINDIPEEDIANFDITQYNIPLPVTSFSEEQAQEFVQEVKSLGFYPWKDRYETTEIICDGGSESVTIFFTDGTVKSTYFYFEYPKDYEKVTNAFQNYLGANLYCGF